MYVPMQGNGIDDICPGVRTRKAVIMPGSDLDLGEEPGGGEGDMDEEERAFLDEGHGGEGGGGGERGGGRARGGEHQVVDLFLDGLVVVLLGGLAVVARVTRAGACPPGEVRG